MPHLILEYSDNIFEKNESIHLFKKCHSILADILPTNIASCKSRAIEHSVFYVGSDEPGNAFVHLCVKVMPGRSDEILRRLGEALMITLKSHFAESYEQLRLQITLEVTELSKQYFKLVSE